MSKNEILFLIIIFLFKNPRITHFHIFLYPFTLIITKCYVILCIGITLISKKIDKKKLTNQENFMESYISNFLNLAYHISCNFKIVRGCCLTFWNSPTMSET